MLSQIKLFLLCFFLGGMIFAEDENTTAQFSLDSSSVISLQNWRYKFGDDTAWSNPNFDDSEWAVLEMTRVKEINHGIRWYRHKIELTGSQDDYDNIAMYFQSIVSAYEIYWDGNPVLQNGKVANDLANEVPGNNVKLVKLKRDWTTPGTHVLSVKLSNHHVSDSWRYFSLPFGYADKISTGISDRLNRQMFNTAIFFLAGLFTFAMFLGGGRHRAYLHFAIYCFTAVLVNVVSSYLLRFDVNIAYIDPIQNFYYFILPLNSIVFAQFFLVNFEIPKRYLHTALAIVITLIPIFIWGRYQSVAITSYAMALLIYAVYHKKMGSVIMLIGLTGKYAVTIYGLYENVGWYYTAGLVFFIFCVTLSISRQIKIQTQWIETARLRSARLEAALLKKNFQPHFLMNTLLSIMSWIEENPKKALKLIQALADEFRQINKISAEKEIPIDKEIALCETHLSLMGHRKDAAYHLEQQNLPETETVPPMIFHTLIENGLTHAYQTGENGVFKLSCENNNGAIHYKMTNDGSRLKKVAKKNGGIQDGMGIKYIKARLEERYPHKWQMDYGVKNELWEVNIIIEK